MRTFPFLAIALISAAATAAPKKAQVAPEDPLFRHFEDRDQVAQCVPGLAAGLHRAFPPGAVGQEKHDIVCAQLKRLQDFAMVREKLERVECVIGGLSIIEARALDPEIFRAAMAMYRAEAAYVGAVAKRGLETEPRPFSDAKARQEILDQAADLSARAEKAISNLDHLKVAIEATLATTP